ncbi:MAG: NADH-quinone oxidoreductase subunit NuoG [Acidimicrobiales bacterium]
MTDTAPRTDDHRTEAPVETVTFTVNGVEVTAPKGQLVIEAAADAGTYIPHFCYHPRMRPVGMCRMCIVEIDTGRGPTLQPSCMIPVADAMVVDTRSPVTTKAQDGVLEFLLINHPLDCPVCDKGGECPLQDQTYAYGPGESRFVEEKRHFEKPIPISDLVLLDRERCILCDRCTRFADEVAGDTLIHFQDRGGQTQVNTFPGHPFASYFSGNTVQICPVGALTASPYRFKARPWDVAKDESTCTTCAVGCRTTVEVSRNRVLRMSGIDVDPVNWGWLCDKGRFGFEAVGDGRLTGPLLRRDEASELAPAPWSEALKVAGDALRWSRKTKPDGIAVLGGARLTNESAYAWAKLAKGVLGTDNVDAQLGDGLPPELVFGLPRATIDDVCAEGGTVLMLAPDLKEELPVLYLRLRDAVVHHGVTVVELSPQATTTTPLAAASLRHRPGEAGLVARALVGLDGGADPLDGDVTAARALLERADHLTIVLGRASLADGPSPIADAMAAVLETYPAAHVLTALRRGNVHGALDMGLSPGVLPGHVTLDEGRQWFTEAWGQVPEARGMDATGILNAAAAGAIDVLVLLGADPVADFPDHDLARRALEATAMVIAVDTHRNDSVELATVVLAAAGPHEVVGTTTNIEGRVSTVAGVVTPPGTARADWQLAAELAYRVGADLGLESEAGTWAEIERVAPSYAGITAELLASPAGRDGVLMPLTPELAAALDGSRVTIASRRSDMDPEAAQAALRAAAASTDEERQREQLAAKAEQSAEEAREVAEQLAAEGEAGAAGEGTATAHRPALLAFRPGAPTELPAVDAYGYRLVATRTLYDRGTRNRHSPSLAGLARTSQLRLNPIDADTLGVVAGARLRVSSPRGAVEVELALDPGLPRGSAGLHVNHGGGDPADLIDVTSPVTTVKVETLR